MIDAKQRFAVALSSPARVADKDGEGWVALFHPEGFVEDPVEAGRYVGTEKIRTFWDVFIGPQPSVAFDVRRDFCGGDCLVRQATVVSVTQADREAKLEVPALIRYRVRDGKIASLEAVWEPRGVIAWFVGRGPAGWAALSKHGLRMTSKVGIGNALAFGGTLVGGLGSARARGIVDAIAGGRWTDALAEATVTIARGDDEATFVRDPARAQACLRGHVAGTLVPQQVLVCGNHVGAFLDERDGPGALAVMLDADGHGRVRTLSAIWEPAERVLG